MTTLRSDRPTCPYRFFRRTAISGSRIYGLLDRLRLHCWEGETASPVFTVELTNTGPRENMAQAWLVVSSNLLLTVHQDLCSVSVLSPQGSLLTTIVTALPLPSDLYYRLM